jgi:uncharacterized protein YutE (UPF0331/DUF86 family)
VKSQDQNLVEQKLVNLAKYLAELQPYLKISSAQFENDPGRRRVVERLVQIIVECAIDTNNLVTQSLGLPPAANARESFQQLHERQVLDAYVTQRYVGKYVGLRNVIVHLYEKVEPKTLYYSAKRLLKDSEEYGRQIRKFLSARARKNGAPRNNKPIGA